MHRPASTRQPVPLPMKSSKVSLVVIMFLYAINVGALMSLQAPFYPLEAQKKGATPAEVKFKRSKVTRYIDLLRLVLIFQDVLFSLL